MNTVITSIAGKSDELRAIRPARRWPVIAAASLVAFGWFLIALIEPETARDRAAYAILVGSMAGTVFGQVTLSAAFCALGPMPLTGRLPFSCAWLAAVTIALGINLSRGREGLTILLICGSGLLVQWLLVQAPIWLLVVLYGLRIVHVERATMPAVRGDQQFGIRQLMILTGLVALVLGVGRIALGGLSKDDWDDNTAITVLVFALYALTNAFIAPALIAAPLVPRSTVVAIVAALGLVGLATIVEAPLFDRILGPPVPASMNSYVMFGSINAFQSAWVLGILMLLRAGGYSLLPRPAVGGLAAPTEHSRDAH